MTESAAMVGITTPLKGIRRTAARRMVAAWAAPVFHLTVEVDMSAATGVKGIVAAATVTDVLLAAAAQALLRVPALNAHMGEGEVTVFPVANIGIAVATEAGLTVPVVHGVQQLGLAQIAERRRIVVQRAREGALTMADVSGGTFTISNLGMLGIDRFDAILNTPQVAILAVGATRKRQVLRDGVGVWLPIAEFTLSCDHRAVDGATGARFLATLKESIEQPLVAQ